MPDAVAPPFSQKLNRHLVPMEEASVQAARAAIPELQTAPLDVVIGLLSTFANLRFKWPAPADMPAFQQWAMRSPLQQALEPSPGVTLG